MRVALVLLAVVLIGLGGVRLGAEMLAFITLPDARAGFANGDGFGDEVRKRELAQSISMEEPDMVVRIAKDQLQSAPFDPVLLSLIAGASMEKAASMEDAAGMEDEGRDMQISARLLDQAMAIAPFDQRVQSLRFAVQSRLQRRQPTTAQLAK